MSAVRFLADEDLRRSIVLATARLEPAIQFHLARDVGLSGRTDADVLAFADAEGYLVVSHDVNTMPAAAAARQGAGQDFSGLLLAPQDKPTRAIAESLVLIWSASSPEEYKNRVIFLPI